MIWEVLKTLFYIILLLKCISYFTNIRCKSKVCLLGKTALITGGNSGLGLAIAKEFAARGCTIIIADKDDATNTVQKLIEETHNPNISSKTVDFTSLRSVRLFADDLKQNVKQLHILANNAGIVDTTLENTEDGIQKMLQVNYFSHFLLTHLLLGLLLKSAPSRIIYTTSLASYFTDLSEDDFKGQVPSNKFIPTIGAYSKAKLAGAIMSRMLSKKLRHIGVTSNVYHPGSVATNLFDAQKNRNKLVSLLLILMNVFLKSPEEGVQTLLYLAIADEVSGKSGKCFTECYPIWQHKQVYDVDFCERIWELSEKYVKLQPEEKIDAIIEQWQNRK